MSALFRFFAKRHILASLFTFMVLLLGLNSLRTLQRDTFPKVDFCEMKIITTYPGASPEDVELNVTNKIEDELKDLTGLRRVTSTSLENVSAVTVTLVSDVRDTEKVKRNVRDAVARVTDLPPEVEESPLVLEMETSQLPIMEVGITGDLPYAEMREIARGFEKKLKEVPGVSRLEKQGWRAREIKVEADPAAMGRYQVPLREIIQAIQARNIRATGGTLESFTSEKNVVTLAQFRDPQEVEEVIVRSTFEGPLIRVKDLALVRDDFEDESLISRIEGRKAISFIVYKSEEADLIRTVRAVKQLIASESGRGLIAGRVDVPAGAAEVPGLLRRIIDRMRLTFGWKGEMQPVYRYGPVQILISNDLSVFVESSFRIVLTNGLIGLFFVMVTLTLFLNLRTAFWVAMGIPVSMLGTFFLMPVFGTYLDSISLTSLILLIGIIVDDGIIISENIYRRKEMGDTPLEAAVNGAREVFLPVLTTVLTTFLAFAPMFFMKGMMGKFVFVIPLTVSLALFISLIESNLALPSHLAKGMERSQRGAQRTRMSRWFEALKLRYAKIVFGFLKFRYILVLVFLVLFVLVLGYAGRSMKFILFPTKAAERFAIGLELPTGTPLEHSSQRLREVEALITELPAGELDTYITRVGANFAGGSGENYAYVLVGLTPYSQRERGVDEIIEELRPRIEALPDIDRVVFTINAGGPPVGKPVSIRVAGNDNAARRRLSTEIKDFLGTLEGVKDIDSNDKPGKEQIEIKLDYPGLSRLGLTVADVAQNVRIAYDGQVVTHLRDGEEDIGFRVQLTEQARRDLDFLRDLRVPNAQNRLIRLGEVARLEAGPGPSAYYHYGGERITTVSADLDQDATTPLQVSAAVLERFADAGERYPGLRISAGGEAEVSAERLIDLISTFVIAILGIYFLLVLLFNSYTQPLLVLVSVPFGLMGVIVALALHNASFSFMGMMGIIGMVGVVVNDSLVLVNHLNNLRKRNPDWALRKVVAEGTSHRLRAILLTTLTTVAGMLPLAYGLGGLNLYMSPMALCLCYGILFATPLTLVLVPCLYMIGGDLNRLFRRREPAA